MNSKSLRVSVLNRKERIIEIDFVKNIWKSGENLCPSTFIQFLPWHWIMTWHAKQKKFQFIELVSFHFEIDPNSVLLTILVSAFVFVFFVFYGLAFLSGWVGWVDVVKLWLFIASAYMNILISDGLFHLVS